MANFRLPIALFAAFCLVLLGVGIFIFATERNAIRRHADESLMAIAELKARAITAWTKEREIDLQNLMGQLRVGGEVEAWLRAGAPQDERGQRIRERLRSTEAYAGYRDVVLADTQGKPLASATGDVSSFDSTTARAIQVCALTGKAQISSLHAVEGQPGVFTLDFCAPVMASDAKSKLALGVVDLSVDPDQDVFSFIQSWPGPSPSAETLVVTRDGDSVLYLNELRHLKDTALRLRVPVSSALPAAAAVRGVEGVMEGADYRGVRVLAAMTSVPETPWYLIAKIDIAEVYAPVRELAINVSVVVGMLVTVTGLMLVAAWRRQQSVLLVRQYQSELQHQELAQRFEYLSKYANDIILLTDGSGQITEANDRALAAYGYAHEELVGRSLRDLHPPGAQLDYATERAAGQRAGGADSALFESLQRRKDGSLFPVEISAKRIEVGGKTWQQIIARDITDRVRAAAAMSRLAAIVQSSRDAIIGTDLDGNVMTWNAGAERLYGYSASEMIGHPVSVTEPAERKGEIRELIKKILSGGDVADFETVRVRKDGTAVDVSIVLSPLTANEGALIGVSAVVRDISERKRSEKRLQQLTRTLQALHRGNAVLVRAQDRDTLQREICEVILDAGDYRLVWIGQAEHDQEKTVRPLAWAGVDSEHVAKLGITWADGDRGRGPTGLAIRTGLPQIVQRVADGPASEAWRAAALKHGYQSGLALPLKDQAGVFGALSIHGGEPDLFGPEEVELLTELAEDLSYGIVALQTRSDREHAVGRLERSMEETIQAVARTIEMRDPYTAGHQERVAKIAAAIATDMGLPADRVHGIRLASTVHDLGKIQVPAEYLSKPGRLLPTEFEVIKRHAQAGYEILKPVEFPWPIAQIMLQHHERLDGSGYPQGLKGEEIILEARIVAVADVVEAMMSHRPFRPALGLEAALGEIEKGKGTLYDPAVADACLKLFRSGEIILD